MIDSHTLALFCAAVLALLVSPGPNMAFLLSHGISDGPRGGLAVAVGIFIADLILTALTVTGVTAIISAWPGSFDVLRYLGALYLLWMAFQALRQSSSANVESMQHSSAWQIFRMALLNSLLNPKALLFFMLFLPQFVVPSSGNVILQLLVLGIILSLLALLFHAMLGLASGKLAALFAFSSASSRWFGWLHASLFVGLAARLLFLDKPSS